MRINRNNYEAFLLDLSEGKLSDELHSELNSFLASNPDLEVELIDEFSTIEDQFDNSIDKDLLKFDAINNSNRKHFFIAYHEGDLKTSEQNEVLQFVAENPKVKKEFDQFSQLNLKSTNEVFKDKKTLHSIAGNNNYKGLIYWSARIAAILLIGFIINGLYQNTNNIKPKYKLVEGVSNLEPSLQHGETIDITKSKVINDEKKINNIDDLINSNYFENKTSKEELTITEHHNSIENKENLNTNFNKNETKIIKRNPALNEVIASLELRNPNKENETIKALPVKNIETPPSLLAYFGEKAREKEILTEKGRPNIVSLINKGSNSITGQDVLAQSQTEQSNSTIFQLGNLKIERINKK